jgi:hypothetical protein
MKGGSRFLQLLRPGKMQLFLKAAAATRDRRKTKSCRPNMTTEKGPISQMLPVYQYRPLSENSIRVLQLLPNRDGNAPIECNLIDYALLDARTGPHLYEAVSYVWGPPPNTHSLIADGASLSIRQNCHAVLARLRDPALPRFLWVDAVCINQEDNDEKTDQVQLMTWIYASARGVIVWLEEPTEVCGSSHGKVAGDLAGALQVIQEATEDSDALPLAAAGFEAARDMVNDLSQRSWFRRIWVSPFTMPWIRRPLTCCPGTPRGGSRSPCHHHVS